MRVSTAREHSERKVGLLRLRRPRARAAADRGRRCTIITASSRSRRTRTGGIERDADELASAEGLALTPRKISYAALLFRKRQALATYASQMNRDIADRVLSYVLGVGTLVSPAERVWEAEFPGQARARKELESVSGRA